MKKMRKMTLVLASVLSFSMVTPAFAGSQHAFLVGADMSAYDDQPAISTIQEVKDASTFLKVAGYATNVVTNATEGGITINTVTQSWLNSGVTVLSSHGYKNGKELLWINEDIRLNFRIVNDGNYSPLKGIDATKGNYSNCKLALIAACYGGLSGGIAQEFQKRGAACSMGWTTPVNDVTMGRYVKLLTTVLSHGVSIQGAIKAANASILEQVDLNPDKRVYENYKTYGSGVNNPIKISRSAVSDAETEEIVNIFDTYTVVENEDIEYRYGDDTSIISYIQENEDSDFEKNLFEMKEIETIPGDDSDMIITYRYKIGDAISDFGYNINIENHKMVSFKKIGCPLYDFSLPMTVAVEDVKTQKLQAFNSENVNTHDEIIEQNVDVIFSSRDKEFLYFVNTTYETSEGGVYCIGAEL